MARWSDMTEEEAWEGTSLAALAKVIGLHPSLVDFSKAVQTQHNFYRIPAVGMADMDKNGCVFEIHDMSD